MAPSTVGSNVPPDRRHASTARTTSSTVSRETFTGWPARRLSSLTSLPGKNRRCGADDHDDGQDRDDVGGPGGHPVLPVQHHEPGQLKCATLGRASLTRPAITPSDDTTDARSMLALTFANPALLWLLLIVPPMVGGYALSQRRRATYATRFASLELL